MNTSSGRLFLWGRVSTHENQELWKTPTVHPSFRDIPVVQVASGSGFTAVLTEDGEVYTVGSQAWFRSSGEEESDVSVLKHWTELSGKEVSHIDCGHNFMVALTSAGVIYAWGTSMHGQLGLGEEHNKVETPQLIESLPQVTQIACGAEYMAAIDADGKCWTWGKGECGALGHGDDSDVHTPKVVEAMEGYTVVEVRCGTQHTALLTDTKDLFTFGSNVLGQLGRIVAHANETDPTPQPVELVQTGSTVSEENLKQADEVEFVSLECLRMNTIALTAGGKIFSCGKGGTDGSGNGTNPHTLLCLLDNVSHINFTRIARSRWTHAAAFADDGSVWIWGNDDHHQLGLEENAGSKPEPVMLFPRQGDEGARVVYDLRCDEMHTVAIMELLDSDAVIELAPQVEEAYAASAEATEEADVEISNNDQDIAQEETPAMMAETETPEGETPGEPEGIPEDESSEEDEEDEQQGDEPGDGENANKGDKGVEEKVERTSTESAENADIKCSGYLQKKGEKGIVKLWRKRWFTLTDSKLSYYEKEGATKKKGNVELKNLLDVLPSQYANGFNVTTRKRRTYELQATTKEDAVRWINAIGNALTAMRNAPPSS